MMKLLHFTTKSMSDAPHARIGRQQKSNCGRAIDVMACINKHYAKSI